MKLRKLSMNAGLGLVLADSLLAPVVARPRARRAGSVSPSAWPTAPIRRCANPASINA